MKEIKLGDGNEIYVDDADFKSVLHYGWGVAEDGTAVVRGGTTKMHDVILGFPTRKVIHINGNGLDNQRSNLKLAETP